MDRQLGISFLPFKRHGDMQQQQQPSTSTQDRLETTKVSGIVIAKLILFSIAMVVLPIGTYFMTVDRVFGGKEGGE